MKIGVIGAGQLGRMLALAGYPMGLEFLFLDRSADTPGGQIGDIIVGEFDNQHCLIDLAQRCDVLTFEFENVSAPALASLASRYSMCPPLAALEAAQDRLAEKSLFRDLGIGTPAFVVVDSHADLLAAVEEIGLPAVLKTRRMGYDGKGQAVLRETADLQAAWDRLGGVPLILEQFVAFDLEVSVVGARSLGGETRCYPLARNHHHEGILQYSLAPWEQPDLRLGAEQALGKIMDELGYAGVLTMEFFVAGDRLLANEIAPRVHNSGHWTIEGAVTSQFENHLRAILDLPLGSTDARGHSAMVNFIGTMPEPAGLLSIPGASLHDYGKTPRPGRKLGHGTVVAPTPEERDRRFDQLYALSQS